MQRKVLSKGERLWAQGDPAATLAVVETGKLGVWNDTRLIGILFPSMVLGETAILAMEGPAPHRRASVSALEDGTTITEYAPSLVKDSFGAGVPRLVLRMLCGQICRNALLIIAAHSDSSPVDSILRALIEGVQRCERQVRDVEDWEHFMVAFRLLYHLRDATGTMLHELVPAGDAEETSNTLMRASKTMKEMFKTSEIEQLLEDFLEAERLRAAGPPRAQGVEA
jgi:CRP-like cAMP-binding protein